MKKIILIIVILLTSFKGHSQEILDTCIRKDWYDHLQHSVSYLVKHDSLLEIEVGLLEDSRTIMEDQLFLTSEQLMLEKALRQNAETNFNGLKEITVSYQITAMQQTEEIKKLKKNRWFWFGGGAAATLITFLIIK